MDVPCCKGVVRNSGELVGEDVKLGQSLTGYFSCPKVKTSKRMGVVVVHDIFGFSLPNCKYIVDYLACRGFDAVMPDFFASQSVAAWPASETEVIRPLGGDEFHVFFGQITSEEFWWTFKRDVGEAVAFLEQKGCNRFGVIGFCWGGLAAETAAKSGGFSATVSVHGCGHSADTYKEVQGNMLYLTEPGDPYFDDASQAAIIAAGGNVRCFEGMTHGFAVRGNFESESVRAAADQAMAEAVELFNSTSTNLRKPRFTKVGALHPDSVGVNCVVKIASDMNKVEIKKGGGVITFYEVIVADETAKVVLSLTEGQTDCIEMGKVICVRNGAVKIVPSPCTDGSTARSAYMRLVVDKWGKIDKEVEAAIGEVSTVSISDHAYQQVDGDI